MRFNNHLIPLGSGNADASLLQMQDRAVPSKPSYWSQFVSGKLMGVI